MGPKDSAMATKIPPEVNRERVKRHREGLMTKMDAMRKALETLTAEVASLKAQQKPTNQQAKVA